MHPLCSRTFRMIERHFPRASVRRTCPKFGAELGPGVPVEKIMCRSADFWDQHDIEL